MSESAGMRYAKAVAALEPNEMLVRFRHFPADFVGPIDPWPEILPHEDHRYVRGPFDEAALAEAMERCAREFGTPPPLKDEPDVLGRRWKR